MAAAPLPAEGPAPVTSTPPPSSEPSAPLPDAPPALSEEAVSAGQEWSGFTKPLSGMTVTFALTEEDRWIRLWKRLSDAPPPVVRFADHMILAVVSGAKNPCDRIQIDGMRTKSADLYVRYREIVRADLFGVRKPRTDILKKVPYHLVVVPRTALKVHFEQIKENPDEK